MEQTSSQHNEATLLPFAGLGCDLSDVSARAALCAFIPVTPVPASDCCQQTLPESLPTCLGYGSGFDMLIALGREIRGR